MTRACKHGKDIIGKPEKWHDEDKHKEIIGAILQVPQNQRDFDLTGLLARAYNNNEEYDKALEQLLSVQEQGEHDAL